MRNPVLGGGEKELGMLPTWSSINPLLRTRADRRRSICQIDWHSHELVLHGRDTIGVSQEGALH